MINQANITKEKIFLVEFHPEEVVNSKLELPDGGNKDIHGLKLVSIYDPAENKHIARWDRELDGIDMSGVDFDQYKDKKIGVSVSAPNPKEGLLDFHWIGFEIAGHMGEGQEFVLALASIKTLDAGCAARLNKLFPGYIKACANFEKKED